MVITLIGGLVPLADSKRNNLMIPIVKYKLKQGIPMKIDNKAFNKHENHPVSVQVEPASSPHFARLNCHACGKWIKWLSESETQAIADLIGDNPQ